MAGTAQALDHFINALALEVAAIRKKGGSNRIEVRGGERLGTAERQTLYRFPFPEDTLLRDDTPVRITYGSREINGTVVSLREGALLIGLDEDVGPTIPFAVLITDDSFLIERLRTRLEEIRNSEAPFNHASASRVIGEGIIISREAAAPPETFLRGRMLNDEQQYAVNLAFGSNTTFVWGPPGTGKTTAVAHIVEAFYRAGNSVLLVSNTNIAVDTALEKVAERLETDNGFQSGTIIRFGPAVKPELKAKYGDRVILDLILARLTQDLERERQELTAKQERLQKAIQPIQKSLEELEYMEDLRREVSHAKASLASASREREEGSRKLKEQTDRVARLRADLDRAYTMGPVRRFFTGLHPDRLQRNMGIAQGNLRAIA